MKVILLRDVAKIGRRGEVKDVSDGYARNFIIRRGFGLQATPDNLAAAGSASKLRVEGSHASLQKLESELERIIAAPLVVKAKASAAGHLFAGMDHKALAAELKKRGYPELAAHVQVERPIKSVGSHKLPYRIGEQVGEFEITVEPA
jgi:large subunit ribosomal protein L9